MEAPVGERRWRRSPCRFECHHAGLRAISIVILELEPPLWVP